MNQRLWPLLLALWLPVAAWAQGEPAPSEVRAAWPQVHRQGESRFRVFGLHIYDARLWRPQPPKPGEDWRRQPLALELIYARSLDGQKIAERSLAEMLLAGPVDEATATQWLSEMRRLFPDVREGDRITGFLQTQDNGAHSASFYFNGKPLGEVRDSRFAIAFFGIWLSPQTSEPKLRQQLLGTP